MDIQPIEHHSSINYFKPTLILTDQNELINISSCIEVGVSPSQPGIYHIWFNFGSVFFTYQKTFTTEEEAQQKIQEWFNVYGDL